MALSALRSPSSITRSAIVTKSVGCTPPGRRVSSTSCQYRSHARTLDQTYGVQGLLRDTRRREDRERKGNQTGLSEARAQTSSRRQSRRQVGGIKVQGDQRGLRSARRSGEAEE